MASWAWSVDELGLGLVEPALLVLEKHA